MQLQFTPKSAQGNADVRDADAAFLCATTADELRDALAQVSDGGAYVDEDSVIAIGPGTFATGGTPFRSEALTTTAKLDPTTAKAGLTTTCGFRPSRRRARRGRQRRD